jgi:hypothetical protein
MSGLLISMAVVCLATDVSAAPKQAVGAVKQLDVNQGTITLVTGTGNALKDQVYSLAAKDIPVMDDLGNKLKLDGLRAGATVRLTLSVDDDVAGILLELPRRMAQLETIDPDKRTITTNEGEDAPARSYIVPKDAKVALFQQPCQLGGLREGLSAEMVLSLDRMSVLSLNGCYLKGADVHGAIIGVDVASHTLTLLLGRTSHYSVVTYAVEKDFHFLFRGELRKASLADLPRCKSPADLPKASTVFLRLTPKRRTVLIVAAAPAQLRGTIREVDAKNALLVFECDGGRRETFAVPNDARIEVSGDRTPLANLSSGVPARIFLSPDGTQVIWIDAAEADDD